jgi:crotonobetainyl-CoA:carnitine CoA-transferase CaiB-like acyl-CoA transferase
VIYCSGSGWGQDTPAARDHRPGQDLLIQAASGLAAHTGPEGQPPTFAGSSIVDASTALTLSTGILAALVARERQGIGQWVQVDLYSTAIAVQCQEISAIVNQRTDTRRSAAGIASPWLSAPCGMYRTADGWLAVAMAPIERVAEAVADPGLAELDAWVDRDEAKRRLDKIFPTRTTDQWLAALLPAGIWAAPARTAREAVDQLRAEGSPLLRTVEHPAAGTIELIGCPITMTATPWQLRLPPPLVGEHTAEVFGPVVDPATVAELVGSTAEPAGNG